MLFFFGDRTRYTGAIFWKLSGSNHETLWLRYLLEHGLKQDGRPDPEKADIAEGGSFETFFTETGSGKYVPRSIFVDLDPSVCF